MRAVPCLTIALLLAFPGLARAEKAPAFEGFATGVQVYACNAVDDAIHWVLKGPDAKLVDGKGKPIAKHFAGPTWQAEDGSKVVGEVLTSTPSPHRDAIAWLVVRAKSHEGTGEMADVSYIIREATTGGMPTAAGCDQSHLGAEMRVPYRATYLFFRE